MGYRYKLEIFFTDYAVRVEKDEDLDHLIRHYTSAVFDPKVSHATLMDMENDRILENFFRKEYDVGASAQAAAKPAHNGPVLTFVDDGD